MYRIRLTLLFIVSCLVSAAQVTGSIKPQCDVDSIGDLWIITLDKSGSMLSETLVTGARRPWTREMVKNDVLGKLSRQGGILDRIDYSRDRITFIETGYGTDPYHSTGYGFSAAAPLDSSFIHLTDSFQKFTTNGKVGLEAVLGDMLMNRYIYRESFVSQIRVLSLHRLIKLIQEQELGLTFRKINILTLTDDADTNDKWKTDYYTIRRDRKKVRQLDELHSRYVFSSFTQKGAGFLDEVESDVTSKNHIYLYEYVTRQQWTNEFICSEDSLISISPLDGKTLDLNLNLKKIATDSICFVYIDTITVNDSHYPVGHYMDDIMCIEQEYDMESFQNDIVISGSIQVQYQDSIYGMHYKKYNFVQYNRDYTSSVHSMTKNAAIVIIAILLLLLFYILLILPNRLVMKVYSSGGCCVRVRRGYRWQWKKLTPLAYYSQKMALFAKHRCFKKSNNRAMSYDMLCGIIIDSPVPLVVSKNVYYDSSINDIKTNAYNSCGIYPPMVTKMYEKTLTGRFSKLRNSRFKWVRRKLHPFLNRLLFRIRPHYYFWGESMQGLISSPLLDCSNLLLEFNDENGNYTNDDKWLNMYYEGNHPVAEVLVCTQRIMNNIIWNVYQLCSRKINGYGISSVKHLIHYIQEEADNNQIVDIRKQLEKAIRRELKVSKILFLDSLDNNCSDRWVHFNVQQATCMAYVCLVECTLKEKCQTLYSPFTDTDIVEKNVVVAASAVSRHIWTSLLPFTSKKKRPNGNIACCESLDIVRESPACQKLLSLKNRRIEFDNIIVKPKKTR